MKGMGMRKLCLLMALGAAVSLLAAAEKPDLSGTWKLNLTKSFLAGDHPASNYEFTKIIEQRGDHILQTDIVAHAAIMNMPLPDSRTTIQLVCDGQEHDATGPNRFPGMPPVQMKVSAMWQGGTLVVIEKAREFGGASTTHRRYFLSDDGSELIELVEGHNGLQDIEQRLIFEKLP